MDAVECCTDELPPAIEDRLAAIFEVEAFPHGPPWREWFGEKVARLLRVSGVCRARPCHRQIWPHELPEVSHPGCIGPEVGRIEHAVFEPIAVGAYLLHPAAVVHSLVLGVGNPHRGDGCCSSLAVVFDVERTEGRTVRADAFLDDERPPFHEFDDIFDLDIVGAQLLDVAKKVIGQRAAVGVARHAAFGPGVVRAFQRGPEYEFRTGVLHAFAGDVYFHRSEVECADVLGEVARVRVVGRMREDRVGIVVDACDDLRALATVDSRPFDARRGSAGAAKKVDVE